MGERERKSKENGLGEREKKEGGREEERNGGNYGGEGGGKRVRKVKRERRERAVFSHFPPEIQAYIWGLFICC